MKPFNYYFMLLNFLFSPLVASENQVSAKALAYACYSCHNPEMQQDDFMDLKKLSSKVLVQNLQAYKQDQKQGYIMNRIAKGLSDQNIQAVATFISQNSD